MNDLRDRMADVLRRRLGSQLDLFPHAPEFLADGVMAAVVQPVLDAKDAEIARLHAGESDQPGGDVHQAWTPAEWLHWFLRAPADERIATVERIYAASRHMADCILDRHEKRIADLTKRAEAAERELAALRTHQQTGDL